MIPNQWYAVLESSQVPSDKPVGVTRMGEKLVFWRDSRGKLSCLRDFCPHRGVALSAGKVSGDQLQCPFHGFEYDRMGTCMLVPANGKDQPVPKHLLAFSYPCQEAHGFIFIWWGDDPPDPPAPRFFDNLEDGFTYASAHDPWNTHYSRVIENQLDVAHVPFVHYNTIGRGNRTLVDGPLVVWQDSDKFFVYVFNRLDDGTPPRKARQLSPEGQTFHLEFLFPNLWQNYISENVRVLAAFVPVDNDHTLLVLRFYQNFIKMPGLNRLVSRMSMPYNVYIAHQDRRIVETEVPRRTNLKMDEKLIPADQPIIAYRRRREELISRTGRPDGPPEEEAGLTADRQATKIEAT
jgi:phenylpropionate dioxygenase-like ring-hydroxylating dioxygenase large terminal subunit